MAEEWKLVFHIKMKKLARDFQRDELERIEEALDKLSKRKLNELNMKKLEGWKDNENRDIYRIRVGRDIRILVSFDNDKRKFMYGESLGGNPFTMNNIALFLKLFEQFMQFFAIINYSNLIGLWLYYFDLLLFHR
ncbi:type II toxin-antitoxin system RelE family toxin [Sulfuracidifex metallicus]|uniref:type II toxin-antitoxin system RelE family toxin n=1 Tax=Sulfuracidifex metallicus TaxID=47303 RepID=UPI000A51AE0C|nr:hypothetical protein [Sulfuracidifex metallicus]